MRKKKAIKKTVNLKQSLWLLIIGAIGLTAFLFYQKKLPLIQQLAPIPPGFGSAVYLDGNSYLEASESASINPDLSRGFTVEAWIKPETANFNSYIINRTNLKTNNFNLRVTSDYDSGRNVYVVTYYFLVGNGTGCTIPYTIFQQHTFTKPEQITRWQHLAGVIQPDGTLDIYVDGKRSTMNWNKLPKNCPQDLPIQIGARITGPNSVDGYFPGAIDEVRISNISRYTDNFTPPDEPFTVDSDDLLLYHFDGNFSDSSLNETDHTAIPKGEVKFGASIPLPTPPPAQSFGNAVKFTSRSMAAIYTNPVIPLNQFTAEAWINPDKFPDSTVEHYIFSQTSNGTGQEISLNLSGNNLYNNGFGSLVARYYDSAGPHALRTDFMISPNIWHHVALVKTPSTVDLFVDGRWSSSIAAQESLNNYNPNPLVIGNYTYNQPTQSQQFFGVIDEVRISDIARYQSGINFAVLLQPFISDANTLALYPYNEDIQDISDHHQPTNIYGSVDFVPSTIVPASPSPLPTPKPSPTSGSVITIYAAGTKFRSNYPAMTLYLNNKKVASWPRVTGKPYPRLFRKFIYRSSEKVTPADQVRIVKAGTGDADKNEDKPYLRIDKIAIDGVTYQTEAPTTFSTGTKTQDSDCGQRGYPRSEWLNCPTGYFRYKL